MHGQKNIKIKCDKSTARNVGCVKILCVKKFSVCRLRNYGAGGKIKSTIFHGYAENMGNL